MQKIDKIKNLINVAYTGFKGLLMLDSVRILKDEFEKMPLYQKILAYEAWKNTDNFLPTWDIPFEKTGISEIVDSILKESLENHETNNSIIDKLLLHTGLDEWQVERIARTETSKAENGARLKRFDFQGVSYVEFVADETERTCKQCGSLHGQIFKLGEEPQLPLHPNCRCTYVAAFPYGLNNDEYEEE